jgi:hypothetical protein
MSHAENRKPRVVLANRRNAGIRVTLLWAADTNTVAVVVRDDATHEHFELLVDAQTNAMRVYEHPYAYAAWRGIDYGTTTRRPQGARGHAPSEARHAT